MPKATESEKRKAQCKSQKRLKHWVFLGAANQIRTGDQRPQKQAFAGPDFLSWGCAPNPRRICGAGRGQKNKRCALSNTALILELLTRFELVTNAHKSRLLRGPIFYHGAAPQTPAAFAAQDEVKKISAVLSRTRRLFWSC
ncbi:MAG: hypothetical protein ACLTU3_03445 [Acutalibacteraceae bacterium]